MAHLRRVKGKWYAYKSVRVGDAIKTVYLGRVYYGSEKSYTTKAEEEPEEPSESFIPEFKELIIFEED
jgi:hypothetical protein